MWTREGSFPKPIYLRNSSIKATFRQIKIEIEPPRSLKLVLTPSSFHKKAVFEECKKVFDQNEILRIWDPQIYMDVHSEAVLTKIKEVFKKFDRINNTHDATEKLFQEFDFHFNGNSEFKHTILDETIAKPQTNPSNKESKQLLLMLEDCLSLAKLKELLVYGANPNQRDSAGQTIGYKLIIEALRVEQVDKFEEIIEKALFFLICYGADFFDATAGGIWTQESMYELAFQFYHSADRYKRCFDLMTNALHYKTTEDALRKTVSAKMRVVQTDIQADANGILISRFKLANKSTIYARLMPITCLNQEDRKRCYEIYKKYFKHQNSDEKVILQEFKTVFANAENVLVNLIYHQDPQSQAKLAGFNVFEIVYKNNNMVWHSWYTVIESECRGLFPEFFAYGFAHGAQESYPNMIMDVYFNPLVRKALAALKVDTEIVSTPKYRSEHVVKKIHRIHQQLRIYQDGVEVIIDGMTFSVNVSDSIINNESKNSASNNLMEHLFNTEFKRSGSEPIAYFSVTDQSARQIHQCAYDLGIDTTYYLGRVRLLLAPYLYQLTGIKPSFKPASHTYRHGIRFFYLGDESVTEKIDFPSPPQLAKI